MELDDLSKELQRADDQGVTITAHELELLLKERHLALRDAELLRRELELLRSVPRPGADVAKVDCVDLKWEDVLTEMQKIFGRQVDQLSLRCEPEIRV
ncbi:hypothetical protein KM043_013362 [Ampulex compressa]|nr:hypothetical protein KM043_013362 [Ampulex compressa]